MVQECNIAILINVSLKLRKGRSLASPAPNTTPTTTPGSPTKAHEPANRRSIDRRPAHLHGSGGGIAFARIVITSAISMRMTVVVRQTGPGLVPCPAHWKFLKRPNNLNTDCTTSISISRGTGTDCCSQSQSIIFLLCTKIILVQFYTTC